MTRVEQIYTSAAVASGTATAVGTLTEAISIAVAVIGALCALISTVAAIYYHNKHYQLMVEEHHDKYHKFDSQFRYHNDHNDYDGE